MDGHDEYVHISCPTEQQAWGEIIKSRQTFFFLLRFANGISLHSGSVPRNWLYVLGDPFRSIYPGCERNRERATITLTKYEIKHLNSILAAGSAYLTFRSVALINSGRNISLSIQLQY